AIASVGVLVRLLTNGHHIGRRIRAARAEHRELVDLVGRHDGHRTRVLPSETLSAYCVPGAGSRLVITEAALAALPDDQLAAVVAHEEAHLRERHDLVLEFFTVLHTATPRPLRTDAALREVALLVEVLAGRAARADVGEGAPGRRVAAPRGSHARRRTCASGTTSSSSSSRSSTPRHHARCAPMRRCARWRCSSRSSPTGPPAPRWVRSPSAARSSRSPRPRVGTTSRRG